MISENVARQEYSELMAFLRGTPLSWLADNIAEYAAEGDVAIKLIRGDREGETISLSEYDRIRTRGARSGVPVDVVPDFRSRLALLLDGLEKALPQVIAMYDKTMETFSDVRGTEDRGERDQGLVFEPDEPVEVIGVEASADLVTARMPAPTFDRGTLDELLNRIPGLLTPSVVGLGTETGDRWP